MKRMILIIFILITCISVSCVDDDLDVESGKLSFDVYEYTKDDVVVSLFVPTKLQEKKALNLFTNIRYIGSEKSVSIFHGQILFEYSIYDKGGKVVIDKFNHTDLLLETKLLRGDIISTPLQNEIDVERFKHLIEKNDRINVNELTIEQYDPLIFLPSGDYTLELIIDFSINGSLNSAKEVFEIKFSVDK